MVISACHNYWCI